MNVCRRPTNGTQPHWEVPKSLGAERPGPRKGAGPLAVGPYPDRMFMLVSLFVKLLLLPFKLVWELIEALSHTSHRKHHRRRPHRR